MLHRTDPATVLEAIGRLGTRGAARELGIHENTARQIRRAAEGNCIRCGKPGVSGKKFCAVCLDYEADRIKTRRQDRRRLGLCQNCDKPRGPVSKQFCEEHRIADAAWRVEREQTRKENSRGAPNNGIPTDAERRRALRNKYGEAAWDCWRAADGCCAACGVGYEDRAIHIHHVDCNEKNHARSNLVCLCFDCHTAVHKLMRLRAPADLLAWFARTYPDRPLTASAQSPGSARP